jgi:flagellar biosynthesis component FlhA
VVYILGLPFAFLGFLAALVIKNSKMQTKEEENAAIQAAKEKEAGDKEVAVKDVEAEDEAKQEKEAGWAEATAAVAPQPEATTERIPAVDSQAALAKHDGKSPV